MKPDWIVHLYAMTFIISLVLLLCTYLLGTYINQAAEELEEGFTQVYVKKQKHNADL